MVDFILAVAQEGWAKANKWEGDEPPPYQAITLAGGM